MLAGGQQARPVFPLQSSRSIDDDVKMAGKLVNTSLDIKSSDNNEIVQVSTSD